MKKLNRLEKSQEFALYDALKNKKEQYGSYQEAEKIISAELSFTVTESNINAIEKALGFSIVAKQKRKHSPLVVLFEKVKTLESKVEERDQLIQSLRDDMEKLKKELGV